MRRSWRLSCLASPGDEPLCEGAGCLGLPGVRSPSRQPTPAPRSPRKQPGAQALVTKNARLLSSLCSPWICIPDSEPHMQSMGSNRVGYNLVTKQQQKLLNERTQTAINFAQACSIRRLCSVKLLVEKSTSNKLERKSLLLKDLSRDMKFS